MGEPDFRAASVVSTPFVRDSCHVILRKRSVTSSGWATKRTPEVTFKPWPVRWTKNWNSWNMPDFHLLLLSYVYFISLTWMTWSTVSTRSRLNSFANSLSFSTHRKRTGGTEDPKNWTRWNFSIFKVLFSPRSRRSRPSVKNLPRQGRILWRRKSMSTWKIAFISYLCHLSSTSLVTGNFGNIAKDWKCSVEKRCEKKLKLRTFSNDWSLPMDVSVSHK